MRTFADRCATSSAGDPTEVIEVAAEGTNVVCGMMRVIGDD